MRVSLGTLERTATCESEFGTKASPSVAAAATTATTVPARLCNIYKLKG